MEICNWIIDKIGCLIIALVCAVVGISIALCLHALIMEVLQCN